MQAWPSSCGFLSIPGIEASLSARAQPEGWPQKPVTIIVPFAAGGNTDGIVRLIALQLGEALPALLLHGGDDRLTSPA